MALTKSKESEIIDLTEFSAESLRDYLVAVGVALPLSFLIAFNVTIWLGAVGWVGGNPWLAAVVTFLVSPLASGFIAEVVCQFVQHNRPYLVQVVTGCFIVAVVSFAPVPYFLTGVTGLFVPAIFLLMGSWAIVVVLRRV